MTAYYPPQLPEELKRTPLRKPPPVKKLISYSEKMIVEVESGIDLEPDIDQRRSVDKALPPKPTTPKQVLHKYRFSALFPFVFTVTSFALMLMFVLAGRMPGVLNGQYMV